MITLKRLYQMNKMLVERFGGVGVGFKDENLAISLVEGVNQEVFGEVLYPTVEDKISYIVFSIIANHVFLDGNKRTGAFVLNRLCKDNNIHLDYSDDELIELVLLIAQSKVDREYVRDWIVKNEVKKSYMVSASSFLNR